MLLYRLMQLRVPRPSYTCYSANYQIPVIQQKGPKEDGDMLAAKQLLLGLHTTSSRVV